jgi:hypothetical protein
MSMPAASSFGSGARLDCFFLECLADNGYSLSAAQRTARLCKIRQSPKRDRWTNYFAPPSTSDLRTKHGARLRYGLGSTIGRSVYLLPLAALETYQITTAAPSSFRIFLCIAKCWAQQQRKKPLVALSVCNIYVFCSAPSGDSQVSPVPKSSVLGTRSLGDAGDPSAPRRAAGVSLNLII